MSVLIIGRESYIAKNIIRYAKYQNLSFYTTSRIKQQSVIYFDLKYIMLSELQRIRNIEQVIICAGITKIADCQSNPDTTNVINVKNIIFLVEFFRSKNIHTTIFSSDYVFDGIKGNYKESDETNALNEYGRQKEVLEKELKDKALILRLGKVYGLEKGDNTIIDEMLQKYENKQKVFAANDQIFNLLFIEDLIKIIFVLIKQKKTGIYNVCGDSSLSRYHLAKHILEEYNGSKKLLRQISLMELNEKFQRPKNTSMNNTKIKNEIDFNFSDLSDNIRKIVDKYKK